MEKRAHVRQPANFKVVISGKNIKEQLCSVKDFCIGGMLLTWEQSDVARNPNLTTLIRNDELKVSVDVPALSTSEAKQYSLTAAIARINDQTMGLAFKHPDSNAIASIQQLAKISVQQSQHKTSAFKAQEENESPHFNSNAVKLACSKYNESQQKQILGQSLNIISDFINETIRNYFKVLNKQFQENINKAKDKAEQNELFSSINKFEKFEQAVAERIKKESIKPFTDYARNNRFDLDYLQKNSGTNKIGLIEKEAFEDWLVVKVMASKAENNNNDKLIELQHRFTELSGLKPGIDNNPISPTVVCYAFNSSMASLPLTLEFKKIIFSTFEQEVVLNLVNLYNRLNEQLENAGILKDFDIVDHLAKITQKQVEKPNSEQPANFENNATKQEHTKAQGENRGADKANPQNSTRHGTENRNGVTPSSQNNSQTIVPPELMQSLGNNPQLEGSVLRTQLQSAHKASTAIQQFEIHKRIAESAADTVKQLISNHKQKSTRIFSLPHAENEQAPIIENKQFVKKLNALQSGTEHNVTAKLSERIYQELQDEQHQEQRLEDSQNAALNIIERLFESIFDIPSIDGTIRPWIKKLEIPFFKLLIKDDDFLQNIDHPARKVLNTVAKLGKSGLGNNEQNLYLIEQSLEKIIQEFDQDISIFNSANHELESLLNRQEKIYNKNIERVQEHAEGQFKIKAAQRFVDHTLENIIAGKQAPKALLTLLDAGWRELLNLTMIRFGSDSEQWKEYENVMHSLMQAINPEEAKPELPSLLRSIKTGLNTVSPNGQFNDERTVSELRTLLTAKRDETSVNAPVVDVPEGSFDSRMLKESESSEDIWVRRAKKLSIGTWLEVDTQAEIFDNEDEPEHNQKLQKVQIRLAWIDQDAEDFVFVNHQGMKIVDIQVKTLANMLREKQAQIIDDQDQPIVNIGLDRMVHKFYEQLVHHSSHDELTGLLNRREFERQIKIALNEARQNASNHIVACFDLDAINQIKEQHNSTVGDYLLENSARLLRENTPKTSLHARIDETKFAILLKDINQKSAEVILKNLIKVFKNSKFTWRMNKLELYTSIGICKVTENSESVSSLLSDALEACSKAMLEGINTLQYSDEKSNKKSALEAWEKRLNNAIANNRLRLHCQKIRALNDSSDKDQYEILLSMQDEQGNDIDTTDFIHAAECFGKMQLIDRWVIKNVLIWLQKDPENIHKFTSCGINLSSDSLNDESLLYYIFENLVAYERVPRTKLCFEVSESTAVNNVDDLADFVQEMQNIGCQFSLDDFGSESSSYSFIKNLPLNYVKIDGSFIRNMNQNENDFAMVKSINEMVHFMGKKTIAKQVEDQATIDKLREIGVDFIQGYAVEAPIALEQL